MILISNKEKAYKKLQYKPSLTPNTLHIIKENIHSQDFYKVCRGNFSKSVKEKGFKK